MNQLTLHNDSLRPTPPQRNSVDLPIVQKLNEGYKLWHGYLGHLPRLTRYTLGIKIDNLFTDCLELSLLAGYAARNDKHAVVQKLSTKFDALKFFLKLLWEIKAIDTKKYSALSVSLIAAGKMIGGWTGSLKKETPAPRTGE